MKTRRPAKQTLDKYYAPALCLLSLPPARARSALHMQNFTLGAAAGGYISRVRWEIYNEINKNQYLVL